MGHLTETEIQDKHVQFSCTTKYLSSFIDSVDKLRDEGKLVFTDSKIYTKVADPANVGMCVSQIKGQALNSLDVVGTDEITIGAKFEKIQDCISGISSTSDLEVTWPVSPSSGANFMRINAIDEDLQFEISTLDPSTVPEMPNADPLSHSTQIKVDGSELKGTVGHAEKMISAEDDGISLETFDDVFQISASDKTSGNFKKQFHSTSPSSDVDLGEHQTYISVKYLDTISKVFGKCDVVTVHIKEDHPVRFDINLDDNGDAKVIYVIAPRLESQ